MKLPTILELAKSPYMVRFTHYQDRKLWYALEWRRDDEPPEVFKFPVPNHDADGATFLAEDKPMFFMRWMKKHLRVLEAALDVTRPSTSGGPPECDPPEYTAHNPAFMPYPPGTK